MSQKSPYEHFTDIPSLWFLSYVFFFKLGKCQRYFLKFLNAKAQSQFWLLSSHLADSQLASLLSFSSSHDCNGQSTASTSLLYILMSLPSFRFRFSLQVLENMPPSSLVSKSILPTLSIKPANGHVWYYHFLTHSLWWLILPHCGLIDGFPATFPKEGV